MDELYHITGIVTDTYTFEEKLRKKPSKLKIQDELFLSSEQS